MEEQTPKKEPQSSFRGLYRHIKISVKTLDFVIVGGIALIVILLLFGIANNGYNVTFDSRGGTDVPPAMDVLHTEALAEPESPTREGYTFTGWYIDENCRYPWDFENDRVSQHMTLYAGWEKVE